MKLTGRSGFDYVFDFVIPKSRQRPERIVSTVNITDKMSAQKLFAAWVDTKEARPADAQAYAVINDAAKAPSSSFLHALQRYEIQPVPWSRREIAEEALIY